ncbi:MAG: DUF748 domain-containing protein [Gammaproteobacteria bacterium]|nr:DUF748 domain-containing protein [Gammaproteobacteria bacterium]
MTVQLLNFGPRLGEWWRRSRQPLFVVAPGWRRLVRVVAGLLLLYLLLTLVALPPLLRWWWPKLAGQLWQQPASLGDVRFHPFDLALTLDDLTLGTPDGHGVPPVAVGHAHLNLALWRSVVQRGWVISELTVNGVTLAAERQADGQIDLAWLWRSTDAEAEPQRVASATPPRLLVEQLQLMATQLSWRDQAVTPAVAVSSDALTVSGSNLGTIDGNPGELVLQLTLADGGALGVNTRVRLQPVAAEGRIAVAALPVNSGWGYWAGLVNFEPPTGLLALDSRFHYHQGQEAQGEQPAVAASAALEQASVVLSDLGLRLRGGEPLLQLQQLQLDGGAVRWPQQQLALEQLTIADGRAVVAWSPQGTLNWQQLLAAATPESARQPPPPVADPAVVPPATPWQFTLGALQLNGLALDLTDERMAQPLAVSVAAIELQASGEATLADTVALQLAVNSLGLTDSRIGAVKQPPLVSVGQLQLNDSRLDLARQQLTLADLSISDWQLVVERDGAGLFNLLPLFTPRQSPASADETSATVPAWQLRLEQLQLAKGSVDLRDHSLNPALAYHWRELSLQLTPLVWPLAGSSEVQLRSGKASAGEWQFDGKVELSTLAIDGHYRIEGMDLTPLQPLISAATVLRLEEGWLYSNGPLQVGGDQGWQLGGTVSVGKVRLVEERSGEPVVGWHQLRADGLAMVGAPFNLNIAKMKLRQPSAKVVIYSDRSTNLGQLRRNPPDLTKDKAVTAKAEEQSGELPLVRIERVEVSDGAVDFADLSLLLPFATNITDFNGVISGISSASKARSTLQLEGEVAPYGEARVSGSLAPAAPRQFSDIAVQFRNLALSPLSPYTATFAGRHIAAGRLNLDLEYRVENSRLNSNNAVVLQGLTLGETVESPDAVSLPLDLAIALLSDSNGKIDIALPVSGDVDSPEFSYGQVIGKAVVNLLTGIVTSPFRALGKLFGEEGALPEQVSYLPGQATLRGAEREKVLNLADVLAQRPQLGLEVVGGFDPDVDRLTLQQSALRVALAEALDSSVGSSELFAPLPLAEAEYQYQLQRLADQRLGKLVVAEVIAEFVTANGREPEQVSALAASIGNASADVAYYQQLANRLIPTMAVGEPQLQALATLRAEAVVTAMTSAGVPPAQLRVAATNQQVKASGGQQALDTLVAVNLKLFSLK